MVRTQDHATPSGWGILMLPALQIRQDHVVPTRRTDWSGVAAELLTTSDARAYDFVFDGPALYLCFGLSGRRKDSVVRIDGERPTHFTEIANRFHVVPAGARFEGFSVPATSQRMVQIYFDAGAGALHPEIDLTEIAPRLAAADTALIATAHKFEAALSAPGPLSQLYGETLGCTLADRTAPLAARQQGLRAAGARWIERTPAAPHNGFHRGSSRRRDCARPAGPSRRPIALAFLPFVQGQHRVAAPPLPRSGTRRTSKEPPGGPNHQRNRSRSQARLWRLVSVLARLSGNGRREPA